MFKLSYEERYYTLLVCFLVNVIFYFFESLIAISQVPVIGPIFQYGIGLTVMYCLISSATENVRSIISTTILIIVGLGITTFFGFNVKYLIMIALVLLVTFGFWGTMLLGLLLEFVFLL